jgi:hypothetical protein
VAAPLAVRWRTGPAHLLRGTSRYGPAAGAHVSRPEYGLWIASAGLCLTFLREEDAVALVADIGKIAEGGRYRGIPGAGEAEPIGVLRRNRKGRRVFDELTAEAVRRIMDFEAQGHAAPLNGGALGRVDWGIRYQRTIRQAVVQGDPVKHGDIVGCIYAALALPLDSMAVYRC